MFRDEGYDKVIAEMAAKRGITPEQYIEEVESRRGSVASRRDSNASEVIYTAQFLVLI